MQINDAITLDGLRRTSDGYLVATAKVARTGIQIYTGSEVGRPNLAQVRVFRPEAEVFSKDTLASFAHRPVTLDHPSSMVTADNWQSLAKGWTDGEIARDGEFIRVSMLVADRATIQAIEGGKRELSMGYTTDLKWEAGRTAAGEPYDAIQTTIRANHLAVVTAARGGSQLRLGDSQPHQENPAMSALQKSHDAMTHSIANAWQRPVSQPAGRTEISLPADLIDGMTSSQMSVILPAIGEVNFATDGAMRQHAVANLRQAVHKATGISPGVALDSGFNGRLVGYVTGLCDAAA
jgi:hypothetical protein